MQLARQWLLYIIIKYVGCVQSRSCAHMHHPDGYRRWVITAPTPHHSDGDASRCGLKSLVESFVVVAAASRCKAGTKKGDTHPRMGSTVRHAGFVQHDTWCAPSRRSWFLNEHVARRTREAAARDYAAWLVHCPPPVAACCHRCALARFVCFWPHGSYHWRSGWTRPGDVNEVRFARHARLCDPDVRSHTTQAHDSMRRS